MSEKFKSIAHCAMNLIFHKKDWTNQQIADEVKRIMGSKTGPGNISWYKVKLKKGELKITDFLDENTAIPTDTTELVVQPHEIEKLIPNPQELIENSKEGSLQRVALEFVRDRDDRSFNKLYLRMRPGMFFHAMSFLKNTDMAEDVVSVALTKIWTKIDQYNPHWNFSTWAYKIVYNESMQLIRKGKLNVSLDSVAYSDVLSRSEHNLIKLGADEQYYIVRNEEKDFSEEQENLQTVVYEKVLKQIEMLPKFYKDIMIDREIHGLKYKAIAEKYNININSVKTRIKRARLQIIEGNPEYQKIVKNKMKRKIRKHGEEIQNEQDLQQQKEWDLQQEKNKEFLEYCESCPAPDDGTDIFELV